MALLERQELLAQLQAQWQSACADAGRLLFVEGEAGIGKSTLIRGFASSLGGGVPVLWGACDAMLAPRPLGPLHDMLEHPGLGDVSPLIEAKDRHVLFVRFIDTLAARPTLAVLEDLHWADEATLDLLRYAGRRMARTHSLLVASFRSDELTASHPLRGVLGDLATAGVPRLAPLPLSIGAVQALAGSQAAAQALDLHALHRTTGGNPFFVTEVLAAHVHGAALHDVPATVQDAVLARAARLRPSARAVLDAAAVAGPRIEPWLLRDLVAAEGAAIDECLATGVLHADAAGFAFRHELARQAVLQVMTPTRSMSLHRLVLQALQSRPPSNANTARLAHHAEGAGDIDAVRRWAPAAAREAAAQGAHRQALEHYARALRHAAASERAALLDAYAVECRVCGRMADALAAQRDAASAWRALHDAGHEAMSLARLGQWLVTAGRNGEGEAVMREAQARLTSHSGDAVALMTVRRHQAGMRMMDHDTDEAIALASEALQIAERLPDATAIAFTHIVIGTALMSADRIDEGLEHLQRALATAEALRHDLVIASTLLNLGSACAEVHRLDLADSWLQRGIQFCSERDIDISRLYQLAWLAMVRLHQGRWDEAGTAAHDVLTDNRAAPIARVTALVALGRLRARRGEPGVWPLLDEARKIATDTGALQRLAPMQAARAEAAWLEGRADDAAREAAAGLELALAKRVGVYVAELLMWCRRGGARDVAVPDYCAAQPFALEAVGCWQDAARAWQARQCPYEAACAMAGSADLAAQREALATFEALGARPMAERTRHRLRQAGVRGLPRGPRESTQQHPAGLTGKEVAVLTLLAAGLRNKEIALRVNRSTRTIDHQLQAIYAKLDVATRAEAVSAAHRIGIVVAPAAAPDATPR